MMNLDLPHLNYGQQAHVGSSRTILSRWLEDNSESNPEINSVDISPKRINIKKKIFTAMDITVSDLPDNLLLRVIYKPPDTRTEKENNFVVKALKNFPFFKTVFAKINPVENIMSEAFNDFVLKCSKV